jgi:hypothetical protein
MGKVEKEKTMNNEKSAILDAGAAGNVGRQAVFQLLGGGVWRDQAR